MVSKLWLNLLLWGLGNRLEKRNDYKTDIMMVLNVMTWYSVVIFSGPQIYGSFFWFFAIINIPASWIGTQIVVGYLLARGAKREAVTKPVRPAPRAVTVPPPGPTDSEEP
jgi:hypothetical protein